MPLPDLSPLHDKIARDDQGVDLLVLVIRQAQMDAFRATAREDLRARLFFRLSTRPLRFGVERLALQIDIGIREADRLHIPLENDIAVFLEAVFTRIGCFILDSAGNVVYPKGATRFLNAQTVPATERILRFAEWLSPPEEAARVR